MHHFFVEPSQIQGNHIFIDGPDVNHIRNVLRMNPGEEVNVTDGTGEKVYRCAIAAIGEDTVDGIPYREIVETARRYIRSLGGFEKFAEWGLVR